MTNQETILSSRASTLLVIPLLATALTAVACSSSDGSSTSPPGATPALRPGDRDSSKVFQGTLSEAESAFWEAVRDGDDKARAAAVTQMKADAADDPTNGYSAFLSGASVFIPPSSLVVALASGASIPTGGGGAFPPDTVPLFQQALAHLNDPLYIGFAQTLLGAIQLGAKDPAATETLTQAVAHNLPASSIGRVNGQLRSSDIAGALDTMRSFLDFCNGSALDRDNPDLTAFVDKANAGELAHRECYTGYFGPHATEGELLLTGDLLATSGQPQVASLYYDAMPRAASYGSWPLRPLAERRRGGEQVAKNADLSSIVACTTCHTHTSP